MHERFGLMAAMLALGCTMDERPHRVIKYTDPTGRSQKKQQTTRRRNEIAKESRRRNRR